ncbi:MAG: helix-turn-helix domain-containing protein, partial [Bacteroidota bacterium]
FLIYVGTYVFYVMSVTFKWVSPVILVYVFLVITSLLVLMVGYFAYVQPEVFEQGISLKQAIFMKYRKSGLTQDYSTELKEELESLMLRDYLYRDSTINLKKLSETLGTTKHNTSQVINEHFNKNFFEFINQYRVEEAKRMLLETVDGKWKWDIIDILIHTGFNNRITFNKVFKKITSITPSDFRQAEVSRVSLS